jgi:hypothetical protein
LYFKLVCDRPAMATDAFSNDICHLRELLEGEYRCLLVSPPPSDGSASSSAPVNVPLILHAARMQVALQLECESAEAARVQCELRLRAAT